MKLSFIVSVSLVWALAGTGYAQTLKLEDALARSVERYDKIKSKQSIIAASEQNTALQRQYYLPDLSVSAQQSYGTVNMLHGPMYAYGGMASAASSMPLAEQNWNAAFGSLYFANINWNFFTFGKINSQVALGVQQEQKAKAALEQEIFQHQVKVSAAYLNLLASQRVKYVQEKNAARAEVFFQMTDSRAKSGLIPEVDARLAKAEVSNARSLYIKSYDKELEWSRQLAVLMGDEFQSYQLDSLYNTTIPVPDQGMLHEAFNQHPLLQLQQNKIRESTQSEAVLRSEKRPSLSAFAVIQGRGSGFEADYAQDNTAYTSNYLKGVGIDRGNYLWGLSLSWNITNLFRSGTKVKEQQFLTLSLQQDFDLFKKELDAQGRMAHAQLNNARANFEETKVQLSAAQLAYQQHTALYENGLTNLVDYTQALYSLNRAEIDYEIAQNNIWQALLLLASARGELALFTQQR